MYAEAYLKPIRTSMVELLCKSQESFIVDVGLGSNNASGIAFAVENVHRMPIFFFYGQNRIQKLIIAFLCLELIKNFSWFNSFKKNPSPLI